MKQHNYFIYITTNPQKTTLYIGVTNNLQRRMNEHYENRGKPETFAGKYFCYNLLHYERFQFIEHAITRETELKTWSKEKKVKLIEEFNPIWKFLNQEIVEE